MKNQTANYLLKHSRNKNDELKYDFMPDILEIIERPAHKVGKIIIFSIFSLLIITVVWSVIAKTDVVVTAQGNITPEGDMISVQAYSSGTVENLNVVEGQYVNEGDLLIEMNSTQQQADIINLQNEIVILTDEADVYKKIIDGTDVDKISLNEYSVNSRSILTAIIESEKEYSNSLGILENALEVAEMEYEDAVETGKLYEGDEQYSGLWENQKNVEKQMLMEKENAELNIENFKSQHASELNNSYSAVENELSNLSAQLEKMNISNEYNKIYSPVSGYINKMSVNTKGDIVTSYEEILTILPSNASLQMKAYINNKDIANVKEGCEVRIKLDAYSYSDYGVVTGQIKSISTDVYSIENIGTAYQVTIELNNDNEKINIISGLSGTAEIKIGERRIISYFIDPLINTGDSLFKEQ